VALALLSHTWLRSDTQIYLPILERLWDPSAFAHDLLAQHPHVSFTVYDEAALALRRIAALDFERVLEAQQFLCRALGILGIFLLATALRLSTRMALLAAAIFSLGAFIGGPTVLAIELEPVPRGFAILLLLFAVGLAAHGRYLGAGIAAAAGFLYHAPSVLPFFIVYFALTLSPSEAALRRRIWGWAPMLAGVVLLFLLHFFQGGAREAQPFLGRIDPELERIQRLRAPYVWVSLWGPGWVCHYLFLWAASLVALWRVRKPASREACFFLAGLPLVGVLAMPASYLLLEKCRWILMPQIQIARAVLLITVLAGLLASAAAVNAGRQGRWWESAAWFLLAFAIPINTLAGLGGACLRAAGGAGGSSGIQWAPMGVSRLGGRGAGSVLPDSRRPQGRRAARRRDRAARLGAFRDAPGCGLPVPRRRHRSLSRRLPRPFAARRLRRLEGRRPGELSGELRARVVGPVAARGRGPLRRPAGGRLSRLGHRLFCAEACAPPARPRHSLRRLGVFGLPPLAR
jgi:hypothetical protein